MNSSDVNTTDIIAPKSHLHLQLQESVNCIHALSKRTSTSNHIQTQTKSSQKDMEYSKKIANLTSDPIVQQKPTPNMQLSRTSFQAGLKNSKAPNIHGISKSSIFRELEVSIQIPPEKRKEQEALKRKAQKEREEPAIYPSKRGPQILNQRIIDQQIVVGYTFYSKTRYNSMEVLNEDLGAV
ncbi:uncharacterized protein C2orf78 homolog [Mixophyes fleayi]|uniref:uncharacterized protein C2orf78 homolog n=1 Tax=Mixophyes fleayi TaxID=3061075 RepID=UPI003F4DF0F5